MFKFLSEKSLRAFIFSLSLSLIYITTFFQISYGAEHNKDALTKLTKLNIEELMNIEVDTVYSASKFVQKTTQAPSYVSIITSTDIKRFGYRTLADILNSLSGFYISYDRNYQYLGIRGFSSPGDYNSKILLLIDGHRINDNIYNTAYIGNEFILDIDLIDRIEVIRGPSSSIYGSNAFFGVINIITKNGSKIDGFELLGEAGSFDTYKQRITFGKEINKKFDLILSASFYKSHGQNLYFKEFDNPATNYGRAEGVDGEKYNSFFGAIKYNDFTIQGGFKTRDKIIPTAPWNSVFNTHMTNTNDTTGFLNFKFKRDIDTDTTFMSRVFYNYYYYDGNYIINKPPVVRTKDLSWGKSWGAETQLNKRIMEKHLITAGIEYQDNFLQKQRNYDELPYTEFLNDRRNSYQWGAFLQDEFSIKDNLILNAGLRYDYFKLFFGNASPRLGLIYNPNKTTILKLLYGMAYRTPNVYELYYNDGNITQKANPDLHSERIHTYEFVIEQFFKNYRFVVSGFYYRIDNLITQVIDPSDGLMVFKNLDDIEAKGIEFEAIAKWKQNIEAKLNYTYQEAKNKDTGRLLVNSPRHLIKSNFYVPIINKKFSSGLEFLYSGKRKTLGGRYAGGALLTNLNLLSEDIIKGLNVSATIYNLMDKKYGYPGAGEHIQQVIEQDGRSFRLKLTYTF
ncbi:MAG: TonB-dependent receptor [Syntrophorhabdaceae bacterium]|nr:TonB-dependent receptor [Syntrophorhabdaceae bacterium]